MSDLQHEPCDDNELVCEGNVQGGPLDGQRVAVRYPKGFIAVNRPARWVWIYDRREDGDYYVRTEEPAALDDKRRMVAAEGVDYDVLAVDAQ